MLNAVVEKLLDAKNILLSTHAHCDGDGLGAEIALCHALHDLGKSARIVNVDAPPKKYDFLTASHRVEVFNGERSSIGSVDLALIFDTNDRRLVEPLYTHLVASGCDIFFIDHHPARQQGPQPTAGSWIDTSAASTGEMTYEIIKALGTPFTPDIARALYTSLVFDTQLFRYVKSDARSHLMAAELLTFESDPEAVHRHLFATYTVEKMAFLGRAVSQVQYFEQNRLAFIPLSPEDFRRSGLERDESGDVIDLIMNIGSVEAAALAREDAPQKFKLSFRSKGRIPVLPLAESFGGGGHLYAAGAHVQGALPEIREKIFREFSELLKKMPQKTDEIKS